MSEDIDALVLEKATAMIEDYIAKIQDAKPPVSDEWTAGVGVGMDWAIRILKKDKSAY